MLVRMRVFLGMLIMSLATAAPAQPPTPKAPTLPELDKLAVDILKDVHNRGAVLNNTGNPDACYYMYEGGLRTVRPFLAHRPAVQAIIDNGLEEVAKSEGIKIKAFRLHEIIEQVRSELKKEIKKAAEAAPPEPMAPPKLPPKTSPEAAPLPKPTPPMPMTPPSSPAVTPSEAAVQGTLTLDGKPLGGALLTIVTTDKPVPRVLSVIVGADGQYSFPQKLAPGEYAMMVTHDTTPVPDRYQTTLTSGLRFSVRAGANTIDLKLNNK